ncbi:BLUF domain-containing protein [Thalassotalea sp. PLHSN55]|uniref:BLUF domain-containing protein n=1 Tax=Thalassotalea sp. PLHSN55 TaxID=3435888 RepID=UPI003F859B02
MIHLIYVSAATKIMDKDSLLELLEQARERNKAQQVTGMLLYANYSFLQVLEGDAKDVDEIYQAIVKDNRNAGNTVVQRKEINKRSFANWSMAFKALSQAEIDKLEGFSEFLMNKTDAEYLTQSATGIAKLLNSFKDSLR